MCMHTRATAPCSTLTDVYIYIVQRCNQIKKSCHQGSGDTRLWLLWRRESFSPHAFNSFPCLHNLHPKPEPHFLRHFAPQTQLSPLPFISSALPSLLPVHYTSAQSAQHSPLPSSHIDHMFCLLFSVQSSYQSQPSTQLCHLLALP